MLRCFIAATFLLSSVVQAQSTDVSLPPVPIETLAVLPQSPVYAPLPPRPGRVTLTIPSSLMPHATMEATLNELLWKDLANAHENMVDLKLRARIRALCQKLVIEQY